MFKKAFLCIVIVSSLIFAGCVIRGRVVDENGAGLEGVTLTLSGGASMTTSTDSRGIYRLGTVDEFLSVGSYTITPSKLGYTFTPASITVTITTDTLEGYGDVPWPVDIFEGDAVEFHAVRNKNIIETSFGSVAGFEDEADTWVWKAIPFASPPVGALQWKAPQDPEPWEEVREETEFCDSCSQLNALDGNSIIGSQDCLYLNVWRPQSEEENLPVYVWIHGGGNSLGHAAVDPATYGANLANRSNMVFVSMNYRLGPYGWFTHPALRTGVPGDEMDDSGNYGTLDIIKALEWIQENIEAFGGDPRNVMITGESAGAMNVLSLMISPPAEDLFHKAMAQSGLTFSHPVAVGEASAHEVLLRLLINDDLAADETEAESYVGQMTDSEIETYLRSKTTAELFDGYEVMMFGMLDFPSIFQDGTVISATGLETYPSTGHVNKVPIIIGSTKEEIKLFLFTDPYLTGKDELFQAIATYVSDMWKAMGVDDVARKLSSYPDQPDVYGYHFFWGAYEEGGGSPIAEPWDLQIGSSHSLDVPFFMGTDTWNVVMSDWVFSEDNRPGRGALSDAMMDYTAQFSRSGDPNAQGSDLPEWKPWSSTAGASKCLILDVDGDDIDIEMSNSELTVSGVLAAMQSEMPDELYSEAIQYLNSITLGSYFLEF